MILVEGILWVIGDLIYNVRIFFCVRFWVGVVVDGVGDVSLVSYNVLVGNMVDFG